MKMINLPSLTLPLKGDNRTIGLLGGSFNPAHGGHLHITLYALNKLGLDEVWWLVSPHNPLKSASELADYEQRLASARLLAKPYRRIRVLDFEAKEHLRYSYETIDWLTSRYPAMQFVWLMGADNLAQFHRWWRWRSILHKIPIVVFDRAPYSHTALRAKAFIYARRFFKKSMGLKGCFCTPYLAFIHLKRDPLSSTTLRKTLGKRAFLGHNKIVG